MKFETARNYTYTLQLSEQAASDLRSALHIATNLLAVAQYDKLLGVQEFASGLHSRMVQMDVPIHPEVLGFESKCHAAFKGVAFSEPTKAPEPVKWEVQVRTADTDHEWDRSGLSGYMRNPSRAEAYRVLREHRMSTKVQLERRVAKVGDYTHQPGFHHIEVRRPGEGWRSLSFLVQPTRSLQQARTYIEAWKAYAMNGSEFRTVFVADK